MESKEIKQLVDRYLDGATTLEEENRIARYFAEHDIVDAELDAVRSMFLGFEELRKVKMPEHNSYRTKTNRSAIALWIARVASVAAVVAIAVLATKPFYSAETESLHHKGLVCYINGVEVYDEAIARNEASRLLGSVSENMQLAMAKIENIGVFNNIK